ncbi:alpha/beta hydrolase [Flavobacterium sp. UMI-01]|uniref:alpha/beta hydrolase n=1 Tax=Flavobacterium sp. UMI-01 TaxID=1441053 RepID=UPI001C7DE41A|nr:alpha/beta hydrolase [Flavobacterium sp. UMI-01]GIZ08576.1 alpha/beta hydrolase [Flavobacterium sp. UMI-01]
MKKVFYFIFTKSIGLYLNLLSFAFPEKANQLAFALFSQPRKGKLHPQQLPKTLAKATFKSITHKGENIATYLWEGNDTVILLVHGWESNSSRWKKTLPYLQATGSTIVALDAPAHGLSSGTEFSIPKYAEWINVLVQEYQPKYLIGHSFGGKTSLYYQSHYENHSIEKTVILGAPDEFKTILYNYTDLLSLKSSIIKGLEVKYANVFQKELDEFTGKHFASKIKTKGLIAHDIHDTIVLFDEGKKIATAWENAVFIETTGLGHALHDEALYHQVISFLFETK